MMMSYQKNELFRCFASQFTMATQCDDDDQAHIECDDDDDDDDDDQSQCDDNHNAHNIRLQRRATK